MKLFKVRTILRRLSKLSLLTINAVWAVPAVMFIRIARPWVHFRLSTLEASRIGHFIADSSILLARHSLQNQGARTVDLFCFSGKPCNEQWACMVRRQLYVRWWVKYLALFNEFIPGGTHHVLSQPTATSHTSIYKIFNEVPTRFDFTLEEEDIAKTWLRHRGWRDGERFVCLFVRDSAYLSSHPLHLHGDSDRWSYHNYRDSDIATYVEASQALIDRGYWVIRMGKIMHHRLPLRHPRVIDYPFEQDQNDLLDIWLSANCYFFIATGSGIDTIPWVYGKPPIVYVNALPLTYCATPINNIWLPKHLRWKTNGVLLTLREHCQHCYFQSEEYDRAGITIESLSPAEITAAVIECEERLTGAWRETEDDKDRQRSYWNVLRQWRDFHKYHGDVHPEARVGSAWLRSMGESFLN